MSDEAKLPAALRDPTTPGEGVIELLDLDEPRLKQTVLPAVTDALLAGRLRGGVEAAQLTGTDAASISWVEQQRTILPG